MRLGPPRLPSRLLFLFSLTSVGTIALESAEQHHGVETVVSVRPFVMVVDDFATAEECAKVLKLIERCHQHDWPECVEVQSALNKKNKAESDEGHKPHAVESTTSTSTAGATTSKRPWRNSTSFQLGVSGELDEAVDGLVRRSHGLARHPITHGEGVQIASYSPGHYYEFHHDSLHRRATVLLYLTDAAEGDGGETIFPLVRADGAIGEPPLPPAVHGKDRGELLGFKVERFEPMTPYCESDYYLKIRPKAGRALLFYSYGPDYSMDKFAIHGACPVRNGRKAIFQRWMRFEPNSLYNASEDEAVRRGRVAWGASHLLEPAIVTTTPYAPHSPEGRSAAVEEVRARARARAEARASSVGSSDAFLDHTAPEL